MKAVALIHYLPIADPQSLFDAELPAPTAEGRDLLVEIRAISVNPVDTKVRAPKDTVETSPRVLGWDAAGVVAAVGPEVSGFKIGDRVFYAGDITRPGANSQYHLVDERIVGKMPDSMDFADAAAFPLVTLTAWEALHDRLGISRNSADNSGKSILIIGGAGGVGSIAIQLAKLAGLTVIATASRSETREWTQQLGAEHIIDHHQPLNIQLASFGHRQVDYIANFFDTDLYWGIMADLIRPQGKIVGIVENKDALDIDLLKSKSATFVWEFMFTRSMFQTPDMNEQGRILEAVASLIDQEKIRSIRKETLRPINAENLRATHAKLESKSAIGKCVLEGWG